jgi:hypothetical protein
MRVLPPFQMGGASPRLIVAIVRTIETAAPPDGLAETRTRFPEPALTELPQPWR